MTTPATAHHEPPGTVLDFVYLWDHRVPSSSSTTLSNYLYFDVSGYAALAPASRRKVKSSLVWGAKGGSFRITCLLSEFNRAVNFHCLRLPIWLASLRLYSDNGVVDDGYGDNETRGEGHLNGVVAAATKKVLILMTDTGSCLRDSAEAIKAAVNDEFGDEDQVFVTEFWTDHTPWPFNQRPRSYNFLVKHGPLWKKIYYASTPRVLHQSTFAATSNLYSSVRHCYPL